MADMVDLEKLNQDLKRLSEIEERLNRKLANREFRKDLFADPVKVLNQEGLVISKEREQTVVDLFKSTKPPENADFRVGTDVEASFVFIGIKIRF